MHAFVFRMRPPASSVKVTCHLCGLECKDPRALKNHMASLPHRSLTVMCPMCSEERSFRRMVDLKEHANIMHKRKMNLMPANYFSENNGYWMAYYPQDYRKVVKPTDSNSEEAMKARMDVTDMISKLKNPSRSLREWEREWMPENDSGPSTSKRVYTLADPSMFADMVLVNLTLAPANASAIFKISVDGYIRWYEVRIVDQVFQDNRSVDALIRRMSTITKESDSTGGMPDINEDVIEEEGLKEAITLKLGIKEEYLGEIKKATELFKNKKMRRSLTPLRTPITSDIELCEASTSDYREDKEEEKRETERKEKEKKDKERKQEESRRKEQEEKRKEEEKRKKEQEERETEKRRKEEEKIETERKEKEKKDIERNKEERKRKDEEERERKEEEQKEKEKEEEDRRRKEEEKRGLEEKEDRKRKKRESTEEQSRKDDNSGLNDLSEKDEEEMYRVIYEESKRTYEQTWKKKQNLSCKDRAEKLLETGGMPLFPPARREWGSVTTPFIVVKDPVEIKWPPYNFKELSGDERLTAWQYLSLVLESKQKKGMITDLGYTLDKYSMFALPGTSVPRGGNGNVNMRLANFNVINDIANGKCEDVQAKQLLDSFEAAKKARDDSTDWICQLIQTVPLRVRQSDDGEV